MFRNKAGRKLVAFLSAGLVSVVAVGISNQAAFASGVGTVTIQQPLSGGSKDRITSSLTNAASTSCTGAGSSTVYTWYQSDNGVDGWTVVSGTTSSTTELSVSAVAAIAGKWVKLDVLRTKTPSTVCIDNESTALRAFVNPVIDTVSLPATVAKGDSVSASVTYSTTGVPAPTPSYLWESASSCSGSPSYSTIGGATSSSFTVPADATYGAIRVTVSVSGAAGYSNSLASSCKEFTVVEGPGPSVSNVLIDGTAKVGETLTGSADVANATTTSYQWLADGSAIDGATSSTFILTEDQLGKVIVLRVTGTRGSNSASADSAPTSAVVTDVEEEEPRSNPNAGPKVRAEKSKLVGALGKPNVGSKKSAVADFLASLNLPVGTPVTFTWMYFVDGEWKPVPNSGSMDYQIEYYLAGHKMKLQVNTGSEIIESEETEVVTAPIEVSAPELNAGLGQQVAGKPVEYQAEGLKIGSGYTLVLRSTPQVLSTGTVGVLGGISGKVTIPKGLEAGWHSLTLTGTNYLGETVKSVSWFKLSATGVVIATSEEDPDSLAATGVSLFGMNPEASLALIMGLLLMMAGAGGLTLVRRRKN